MIHGGGGGDSITPGDGNDTAYGEGGGDTFHGNGDGSADYLDGGGGLATDVIGADYDNGLDTVLDFEA